uniref:non-specific serine/threonine protein kinase n=1 Tax=Plectus sambesii TaxID=2011161 RepID=A0A914VG34_9BILA
METIDVPQSVAGYNVSSKLGTGSFATVYKGTSIAPRANGVRETVAIKCIDRRSAIATKISSDNIVSEIAILKRMKHRHIVQLLDFQWDKKYIYLIIEFCGGGDLSSFIRLHQCLPERVAQKFFRQLASAIKYLRSFNIAHMDLKPQNILLTSRHRPVLKVADFGFAQHLREESGHGHSFRGSPLYMAPEVFTRQKYDARVDLWSCGVILYECLYGRAPFACGTMDELIKQITSHESVKLPPTVALSDECLDLLKGLLVRNPSHRISFDAFFSHPFVDLDHAPSDASLDRANSLIVKSDTAYSQG